MLIYDADIIIAGAGLAGLTLARELQNRGYIGRIVILDRRDDLRREQRWCTWGPINGDLAPLVAHSWNAWQVIGDAQSRRFRYPERPYLEFQASRYLQTIAGDLGSTVDLVLGADIYRIDNRSRWVDVETSQGSLRAKWMIDARGAGALPVPMPGEMWLWQSFVGFIVKTDKAVFEPGVVTLMDFRETSARTAEFFYVLPYSATQALVECTVVDREIWPLDRYREHLNRYLDRLGLTPDHWVCESEEIGAIPMTTHQFSANSTGAVIPLGLAAGAAKPSTGYGFARARKQASAVADALLSGRPPRLPQPGSRSIMLDTILLEVVAKHPMQFRRGMLRMFERIDAPTIVRFLSEESSFADDMRIATVVGSAKFAEAAASRYLGMSR